MKILILGNGYVASHLQNFFGEQAEVSSLRVRDHTSLKEELLRKNPEVVINCIGKTGRPNVDWCESHKMETLSSNVTVPLLIAEVCEELGLYFVHVGSGCIYEGDNNGKGFSEEDPPNFFGSFYSRTKAWSEAMLNEFPLLQLRLRMPVDGKPGPRNFVTKITKYAEVASVPNSISVMKDFLEAARTLIQRKEKGIFNMTNPGIITHKEILDMYREIVDPTFTYKLIPMEVLAKKLAAGRSNCILSSTKLESHGILMRPIHEAIRDSLHEYKAHLEPEERA